MDLKQTNFELKNIFKGLFWIFLFVNISYLSAQATEKIPWGAEGIEELCAKEEHYHTKGCTDYRTQKKKESKRKEATQKRENMLKRYELIKSEREERKEECKTAQDEFKSEIEKKKETQKTLREKQHEMETKVSEAEKQISKDQTTLAEELNTLQNQTNQEIQKIRESLKGEMSSQIETQTKNIQNTLMQLQSKLEANKIKVDTAYLERRKFIHAQYQECFASSKVTVEKERAKLKELIRSRRLSSTSLQTLARGTQTNIQWQFQKRLNAYIHLCLNSQDKIKQKQMRLEQFQLQLKTLALEKRAVKRKIAQLEMQFHNLVNNKQLQIVQETKEKIQARAKQFHKSYDLKLKSFETTRTNFTREIQELKRKHQQEKHQHYTMEQMTPQDARMNLLRHRCNTDFRDIEQMGRTPSGLFNDNEEDLLNEGGDATQ